MPKVLSGNYSDLVTADPERSSSRARWTSEKEGPLVREQPRSYRLDSAYSLFAAHSYPRPYLRMCWRRYLSATRFAVAALAHQSRTYVLRCNVTAVHGVRKLFEMLRSQFGCGAAHPSLKRSINSRR